MLWSIIVGGVIGLVLNQSLKTLNGCANVVTGLVNFCCRSVTFKNLGSLNFG